MSATTNNKEQVTGFGLGGALKLLGMFSEDADTRQIAEAAFRRIAELNQALSHIDRLLNSGLPVSDILSGVQEIINSASMPGAQFALAKAEGK